MINGGVGGVGGVRGGGAAETGIALRLGKWSKQLTGMESYAIKAFGEALETIPFTLAENAGLQAIEIVTELRKRHASGEGAAGINVRESCISDMAAENVL